MLSNQRGNVTLFVALTIPLLLLLVSGLLVRAGNLLERRDKVQVAADAGASAAAGAAYDAAESGIRVCGIRYYIKQIALLKKNQAALRAQYFRELAKLRGGSELDARRVVNTVMHLKTGALRPGPDNYDRWVTLPDRGPILTAATSKGMADGFKFARSNYNQGPSLITVDYKTGITGTARVAGSGISRTAKANILP